MSSLPTQNEKPLCKCRVLYLGTTYYKQNKQDSNFKINLNLIQNAIASRYPINGEKFAKGIETWLSIYASGLQMEHSVAQDSGIDGIFLYPIRSLIYCAALRLSNLHHIEGWKFVPLDSEEAELSINLKNPPLFVAVVRGAEPSTHGESIECHVFVVGMKKTAMRLVESCQKCYSQSKFSVNDFRQAYGSIPAVYTANDGGVASMPVKKHDDNGFFYVIDDSSIDVWQLYEADEQPRQPPARPVHLKHSQSVIKATPIYTVENSRPNTRIVHNTVIDPYEDAPNLVKVERRFDPNTGQNIYVRWLQPPPLSPQPVQIIETMCRQASRSPSPPPITVIHEQAPSPPPIIYEKIIQKKKPQVIIKEVHVNHAPRPPIKVVKEIDSESEDLIPPPKHLYKDQLRPEPLPHPKYMASGHRQMPAPPLVSQQKTYRTTTPHRHHHQHETNEKSRQPQVPVQPDKYYRQQQQQQPPPQFTHYHHQSRRHHHHHHHHEQNSKLPHDLLQNIDKLINSTKNKNHTSPLKKSQSGRKIYVIHEKKPQPPPSSSANRRDSHHHQHHNGRKIIVIDEASTGDEEKIIKKMSNGHIRFSKDSPPSATPLPHHHTHTRNNLRQQMQTPQMTSHQRPYYPQQQTQKLNYSSSVRRPYPHVHMPQYQQQQQQQPHMMYAMR